ncbi:MAG: DUF512 domain-containing protein [Oscillospiraceae bacterium]|nr:DUF512 domain-containing protein [Oscillospiraceae bacterium]
MKNIVSRVDPAGPLCGAVKPGDELLSINGKPIRDVLDYKYYSYEPRLLLEVRRPDGRVRLIRLRKAEGRDPGLEFETYLMDRARSCANRCLFCFIDQNPPGMRKTVYFKDDDARLSFLMGCYITLTNLSRREIQRIIDLHVSPVNISVHATDGALRQRLLGNPRAGELMEIMGRFAAAGIRMNCQIVCCPGYNDAEALDRTLRDLGNLYPAVHSISVVPVGLTRHRKGLCPLRPFTQAEAADTIRRVNAFGEQHLRRTGTRLAFCSDELYQLARLALPPDEFYEEHTQLENGVGMLRLLESEFLLALREAEDEDAASAAAFSIATGFAAAPMLESLLARARERFPGLDGRLYPIRNDFFGETVTVAGLITGRDLIAQLRGRDLGARLLISETMLRREERDFLDSVTLAEAGQALGVSIVPVPADGGALLDAMLGRTPVPPQCGPCPEGTGYQPHSLPLMGEGVGAAPGAGR